MLLCGPLRSFVGPLRYLVIPVLSILWSTMAVFLKCLSSFLIFLGVIIFIRVCSVSSHSQDNYDDALRTNRGKLFIVCIHINVCFHVQ